MVYNRVCYPAMASWHRKVLCDIELHHGLEMEYLDIAECRRACWNGKVLSEHQEFTTPRAIYVEGKRIEKRAKRNQVKKNYVSF